MCPVLTGFSGGLTFFKKLIYNLVKQSNEVGRVACSVASGQSRDTTLAVVCLVGG